MVRNTDELVSSLDEMRNIVNEDEPNFNEIIAQLTKIVFIEASLLLDVVEELDDLKQRIK